MAGGLLTARGYKEKPNFKPGQSRPERLEQGTKRHKVWLAMGTSGAPLRESGILKHQI
jgi:hypothetical protein